MMRRTMSASNFIAHCFCRETALLQTQTELAAKRRKKPSAALLIRVKPRFGAQSARRFALRPAQE